MSKISGSLSSDDYLVIKKAVSIEQCQLIADYLLFKSSITPNVKKGDAIQGVHREYGDLLMESLLNTLTPLVEESTGLDLWPTLSFYYLYKTGNELLPHKDRSSCEFVAGLYIGSDPTFLSSSTGWPMFVNGTNSCTPVSLEIGDLVIFKGHETEHWREPFQGLWYISAIFGFVNKNGPFAFQKFDQRKTLGTSHVGMFHWLWGCIINRLFPS